MRAERTTDGASEEAQRAEQVLRRERTVRIHVDADPEHLNPMAQPTRWTLRIAQDTIFETLVRHVAPEGGMGAGPGRYQPGLASAWRIGAGGRDIRFDLHDGVRFHDGSRLTSVDVQFSIDAARSRRGQNPELAEQLADVSAVELIGPRALRVRLHRPNGFVLRALAEVPILPEKVYGRRLSPRRDGPVVGSGPYRLASWDDDVVALERFEDYWGAPAAIERVEFVYEPDAARALTEAKQGGIDIVPALIPAHHPEQAVAPGIASRFAPLRLAPPSLRYAVVDTRAPPFDDARVRRALALLIDRKALVKDVHDGLARAIAGPVWPGGPGDGAAPAPPGHDPAAAARLLDEAGWRDDDGDGIREKGGQRLMIVVLAEEKEDPERDTVIAGLRRSGIIADVRVGSAAVLRNRLRDGAFDLAFLEWRGEVDTSLAPLLASTGAMNYGGYADRELDGLLLRAESVWEPAARAQALREIAAIVARDWPIIPITAPAPHGLVHKRVRGVEVWDGWISLRALSLAPSDGTDEG